MELTTINNLIDELESSDTSLSNIRNLSALYNVKSHLIGTTKFDTATKELNDILPSYMDYIKLKRQYQLNEIPIDNVLIQLDNVCKEIGDFLRSLYCGTDTKEERQYLHNLINQLKEAF